MIGHHLHEPTCFNSRRCFSDKFTLPLDECVYHPRSELVRFSDILHFAFSDCDPVDLSGELRVLFSEYGKFAVVVAYGHGCGGKADKE